jgi:small-conductance mechanosensitive channel
VLPFFFWPKSRPNVTDKTNSIINRVIVAALWTLTVFIVLDVWAVLVGVVTIIGVGFIATWAMTSNFTASFFLVLWRPFHVGQTVEIFPENIKGRVVARNLMFTTLSEDSGSVLQIPNSLFSKIYSE